MWSGAYGSYGNVVVWTNNQIRIEAWHISEWKEEYKEIVHKSRQNMHANIKNIQNLGYLFSDTGKYFLPIYE